MKKIILTLSVSCFSMAYSQNLNFADSKFKALILSSSTSNDIAKNISGNPIAVDTNGDGEIQVSEAQQVKILTIKKDGTVTYNDLPDTIDDATLFTNMEELYIYHTKSAVISFVGHTKIKKVLYTGTGEFADGSGTSQVVPVDFSFDNCSAVQDINEFASDINMMTPVSKILRFKNCPQLTGNMIINSKDIKELYLENLNINTLTFNSCQFLGKISVPNLNTLTKVSVLGLPYSVGISINQNIELIANNCTNLQEIIADTDHYNTNGAYFSSVNLNGASNLKKIKGLNTATIDFSTTGLVNLEELDCSFYNRNTYSTTSGVYFGDVTSLNLTGLPKLKILKAFNQKITNNVNFSTAQNLENIDITGSAGYMNWVNVNNLAHLHTLKTDRFETSNTQGNDELQKISAKNCTVLTNLIFRNNNHLKELDIQNCLSLQRLAIGFNVLNSDGIFTELQTVNLQQCTGLQELTINNTEINALNISECVALKSLELAQNSLLPAVNVSNNINLEDLTVTSLPLVSSINTYANINLKNAYFNNCPQITELNFSNSSHFQGLTLWNMPLLTYVNLRNGSIEEYNDYLNYNSNLSMCVDNAQLNDLQNLYSDITFTTNCGSFLATNDSKSNKIEIIASPNPVKDFIQLKSEDKIKNIKIFDAQGRAIFQQSFNQDLIRIDLSAYPHGIYVLKIKTDKTEISKKIIKE
ncbi:T9SS type A sorting domain-containing protein [Chryseobacterium sp. RP-3-3]|uniref:T9SS type A sorting domain-containing protein n=1 Tax=Chryseobacterium antibioticum TaxID=2728847 RepID=A0A7Y0FSA0_9FLAO|nr:T9SS type A sorting domain-containing protein [Chryseobacterium antibioticum]NML70441.1 T9SS type A sorting domain-containing protein [Chryseobacterium antibioticum]